MSLLSEIQEAAINTGVDITTLLRKCKVLASRLGNVDFKSWVDYELEGYPSIDILPAYRILKVESYGNFSNIAWKRNNAIIPPSCIPEEYRDLVTTEYMVRPISYYASLVGDKKGVEPLAVYWPPDLVAYIGNEIYKSMQCSNAWKQVTVGLIVEMIEKVRNNILNFVLKLDEEVPDVGAVTPNSKEISEEKISQIFNITIKGDVENVAAGYGHTITYNTKVTVVENDLESLKKFLADIGVDSEDLDELEESIKSDEVSQTEYGFGDTVKSWLGKTLIKVGASSSKISTSVAASLITQALLKYSGL